MQYRNLGNTGLLVSEIGIGCEGFAGKDEAYANRMIDTCLAHGVNCLDLYSSDPEIRSNIGTALRGRRAQMILQGHLCTIWKNGQYERTRDIDEVHAGFHDLLARLETDFIDIGMVHYVDSLTDWEAVAKGPVMEYARKLKQDGTIKAIGLSSHNPAAALAAVESDMIDVLMFSVNPCYDLLPGDEDIDTLFSEASYQKPLVNLDPQREALYETCQRQGVGITVMKAFGGGDLLSEYSPAGRALTAHQCLHYALTRPAVASVMTGARTLEELEESISYETATEEQKDYAAVFAELPRISWQGHCMYCGHCAPCVKGIDVAAVTKFLNLARAQGNVPETVRGHYALLSHTAGECIRCGACETRCPFGVPIIENMQESKKIFGR